MNNEDVTQKSRIAYVRWKLLNHFRGYGLHKINSHGTQLHQI